MGNELSTDVIDLELYQATKDMEDLTEEEEIQTDYSEVSEMTVRIQEDTENLVREQKIPDKDIIGQVSVTDMVIDLAMASLAKQTSVKIQKLETFLGKLEDRLFDDKNLSKMKPGDLANLYTSTRMMRTDAFRMLKEIKKDVDFSALEANLLSLHSKEAMNADVEGGDKMKSLLQSLLTDDSFIEKAESKQKNKDKK